MHLLLLFDRIKNKIVYLYRNAIFRQKIQCQHKDFSIVGKITLINTNIKIGHNVTIYPNCLFFGDGEIVLGDNVDIGEGTIIYSSSCGGGTYWQQHKYSWSMLYN